MMNVECRLKSNAVIFILLFFSLAEISAQTFEYTLKQNIGYYDTSYVNDPYIKERCKLDIYYPSNLKNFATVVWFHGGGLTSGEKFIPEELKEKGYAVVAVNYRLNPKAKSPAYIEDAAAAVAWVYKNISQFGGNNKLILLSGHSAGGYLITMIGLDKKWLSKHGVDSKNIAALIPFSGQMITHFTIRKEKGIPEKQPIIDEFAPLFHVSKETPPLILITGDKNNELLGRYEENAYMFRMMQEVENKNTELYELEGFDHGAMAQPAFPLLLRKVQEISEKLQKTR